ncbi:MAG TPA: hypothetical protein VLW50_04420 [Streptosporangiaceae bacterium]|nr:hypothetical protein [Streptosporangiaceae bacterium]
MGRRVAWWCEPVGDDRAAKDGRGRWPVNVGLGEPGLLAAPRGHYFGQRLNEILAEPLDEVREGGG